MKVYKATLLITHFESEDKEELKTLLGMCRHVDPSVVSLEEAEIGEWDDSNPLNFTDTQAAEMKRLFG